MKFQVQVEIFKKFPGVRIGVLVVQELDNTKGGEEIAKLLTAEEKKKKKELTSVDLKQHPKIAPWREIYRQFGSKPRRYRSSVESLTRRVVAGNRLPNINPLVDLYNFISLKYLLPVGAENLDKVKDDIVLGFAQGNEQGKYIGSEGISTCYPGEVVYKDDLGFICRRWNWREGERTKITPETKNAVVVIEANQNVSDKEFKLVLNETAELIEKYLGAKVEIKILDIENNDFDIDFEPGKKLTEQDLVEFKEVEKLIFKKKTEKPEEIIKKKLFKVDRASLPYKLKKLIYQAAVEVVGKRAVKLEDVLLEHPTNPEHGDYSTNLALRIKKRNFPTPWDLANQIVNTMRSQGLPECIAKIEVTQPGFVNLWLQDDFLVKQTQRVLKEKAKYGSSSALNGRKILLEHTSPNPQTTIMLGHLRNNFLGMSMTNILEFLGAKVTKDCIVNDRGVHLCKSIWGYLVFSQKRVGLPKTQLKNFRKVTNQQIKRLIAKKNWQELLQAWMKKKSGWWQPKDLNLKPDHANLIWYVLGSRAYDLSEEVRAQMEEILIAWEKENKDVWQVWRRILGWSDKGYQQTYERVGSVHDYVWHEHKLYKSGKELVYKGLKKGVFRESKGVIVSDLSKYGLSDTVLIKSDGTAVYHTYDLNLTLQKKKKFPADLYIWDIGVEQSLYFRQLFAMAEQLGIGKRDSFFHLAYALINFKGGKKMSTRRGEVIMTDEILDELHRRALEVIKASNQELRGKLSKRQLKQLAEKVAVGAIKYSLLKFSRDTTIYFDPDESLSLEGNSGPYLQYTYARCQSVLKKVNIKENSLARSDLVIRFVDEELAILRTLYKFPEVVLEAGENFAPNLICNFLFDLAHKYNLFYNKLPILKAGSEELRSFRLALTITVGQVIKNGLNLLGIGTPERM